MLKGKHSLLGVILTLKISTVTETMVSEQEWVVKIQFFKKQIPSIQKHGQNINNYLEDHRSGQIGHGQGMTVTTYSVLTQNSYSISRNLKGQTRSKDTV